MPARYLRHGSQPEEDAVIRTMPMLQPFWAAGFSFSRGHFKVQVPYDGYQPMVFQVHLSKRYCWGGRTVGWVGGGGTVGICVLA